MVMDVMGRTQHEMNGTNGTERSAWYPCSIRGPVLESILTLTAPPSLPNRSISRVESTFPCPGGHTFTVVSSPMPQTHGITLVHLILTGRLRLFHSSDSRLQGTFICRSANREPHSLPCRRCSQNPTFPVGPGVIEWLMELAPQIRASSDIDRYRE